jgi:hypothetical protein
MAEYIIAPMMAAPPRADDDVDADADDDDNAAE